MVNRGPANGGMILCMYVYICLCLRLTLSWPTPPPHCRMASRLDDAALPDSLQVGKKDGEKREMTEGERNRERPPYLAWTSGFRIVSTSSVHSDANRNEWYFQYAHEEKCRHLNIYINHTLKETHAHKYSHKTCTSTQTFYYVFPLHTEKWRGCLL